MIRTATCPSASRVALGAFVLSTLGFGAPNPTWTFPEGGGLITPAASDPTSGLNRREITLVGPRLVIPVIAAAETSDFGKLYTVLEFANIHDAETSYSFRLRDADGADLSMPFQGSCPTCAVPASSHQGTISSNAGGRAVILPQNPLKIGWAEFTADPEATLSVSAMLYVEGTDGTVGRAGIPPTSMYRRAWLYNDNTSDFTTRVILVNPSTSEAQTIELRYHDFSNTDETCEANVHVPALGQAIVETGTALACSSEDLGLIEIGGQGKFTGIAIISHDEDGTIFTRPFVDRSAPVPLEQWSVATGMVTYGTNSSAGCVAVSETTINGVVHTVHTSKWQKRVDENSPWTDVPNTAQTGMVCAYSPSATEPGQYRGVAEISVDGERGIYVSSNFLTVEPPAEEPAADDSDSDEYTPLQTWTVSDGRVQFSFFSAGRCVQLSNSTINGVTYTIHTSKWQKRADADSAWEEVPDTEATGGVCSYSPTEPGQYRGVAEITIGGTRGKYSTKNFLTNP